MLSIGIDPGQKGGIVSLLENGEIESFSVMKDSTWVADYLESQMKQDRLHVWLEKAQAMPKNGAVSMFNYGTGFGTLLGILIALRIPHTLVPPKTWTKVMHAGTKAGVAKIRSLEASHRLAPGQQWREPDSRSKKQHDGLVDAFLIAEYGRRLLARGERGEKGDGIVSQ